MSYVRTGRRIGLSGLNVISSGTTPYSNTATGTWAPSTLTAPKTTTPTSVYTITPTTSTTPTPTTAPTIKQIQTTETAAKAGITLTPTSFTAQDPRTGTINMSSVWTAPTPVTSGATTTMTKSQAIESGAWNPTMVTNPDRGTPYSQQLLAAQAAAAQNPPSPQDLTLQNLLFGLQTPTYSGGTPGSPCFGGTKTAPFMGIVGDTGFCYPVGHPGAPKPAASGASKGIVPDSTLDSSRKSPTTIDPLMPAVKTAGLGGIPTWVLAAGAVAVAMYFFKGRK